MLETLFLVVVALPLPLLALTVLVVELRGAVRVDGLRGLAARIGAALRAGIRRPVWRGLLAVVATAGLLTAGLEQCYLAAVANGSRWGFDVALLAVVLGLLLSVLTGGLVMLTAAAVGRARGFGAGTVGGLLTLLGVAVGTAAAHLPLRAAYLADPSGFPVVDNLGAGDLLIPANAFLVALLWALPWPVLGAALGAHRVATEAPAPVRDVWHHLLNLATTDLPENRATWGTALRAELASIDPRAERRRFALGGAWAALRSGPPQGAWVPAAGVAVAMAAGSFAASRWSLAHERGGILGFWMSVPTILLFAVALLTAYRTRSFGAALRASAPAGAAAMVAVIAVGIPEAVIWANRRAGYLSTGDAVPPDWQSAVGDVLRPEFLVAMAVFWIIGATGGAAVGTAFGRLRTRT
ncbi:hypothetical protein GCM10010112_49270 [Actinoplanes lobatus]|uniref:Uncharacterized protein n=1 Tax=Actinoplanes lobatus TaxID=113568 RepID=A0A7W7HP46_9ACTN|nr:hypothetical protein [Actinoplanes lobatus]MBB4754086.1 hypothetical protein [Actinoplanes lobatus]GGN76779.1 hypothetical protein GCM10010112_49270 [Actinoplanes lobatus]GIE40858.1 hypothetical protein Alo02nite_37560 [Actinoplanes lobatus]